MKFVASGLHARRFKTSRTILALILREMVATYGRSPGGYIWAVLEPVGGLAILTIAFSMAFRNPPIGDSFPLFYATGYLPFMLYSDIALKIGKSLRYSRPLLAYPAVTYNDSIFARFILNSMTHALVFFIITAGIFVITDATASINLPAILLSLLMAAAVGLGVGTLNCFLMMQFPIWERLWGIFNRPMFLISGIFFMFERIPEPYSSYIWLNPLIHVVGKMRSGFYPTYDSGYVSELYCFGFAFVCMALGQVFLGRYHRDLLSLR